MPRLLMIAADDFWSWPNFQLIKAFRRACALVAALFFTTGYVFAADSSLIAPGAQLEKLGGGYGFTEGPAADRDGNVFFTDHPNDRIVKWSAADVAVLYTCLGWMVRKITTKVKYMSRRNRLVAIVGFLSYIWSIETRNGAPKHLQVSPLLETNQQPTRPAVLGCYSPQITSRAVVFRS